MEKWNVSWVCEFLASKDFDREIVKLFQVNKISARGGGKGVPYSPG